MHMPNEVIDRGHQMARRRAKGLIFGDKDNMEDDDVNEGENNSSNDSSYDPYDITPEHSHSNEVSSGDSHGNEDDSFGDDYMELDDSIAGVRDCINAYDDNKNDEAIDANNGKKKRPRCLNG